MVADKIITNCMFGSGIRFDVQPGAAPEDNVKIHGTFGNLRDFSEALEHEISSKVSRLNNFISIGVALPDATSGQQMPGITSKVYVYAFSLKSGVMLRSFHLKKKIWDDEDEFGQVLFWTMTT